MRTRRRQVLSDEAGENFWPSFADLTSTIALILFVLVVLAYIQNLASGRHLERVQAELRQTLERLSDSQRQIRSAQDRLRRLSSEITAGQARLALSQAEVARQQELIAASNRELEELRSRLQAMGVLRLNVLEKVKQSLEGELQKTRGAGAPLARIADNGNIVLDESLLFESNSHTIKDEGRPFLDSLATAFSQVLADPEVRKSIDVITVQGHTDERGTSTYNRELSARRANAVLDYIFQADPGLEQQYGSYFASSAYSEFRPIDTGKNEAAYRKNRRIEISVVLRDSSIREVIDEYIANQPSLAAPGALPPTPAAPGQPPATP